MPKLLLRLALLPAMLLAMTPARAAEEPVPLDRPRSLPEGKPSAEDLLDGVGRIEQLLAATVYSKENDRFVATLADGSKAELTLDSRLQKSMKKILSDYRVPYGAVVALDPRDGRILAMAEHSQEDSSIGLATRALYPAASVFKIVTGAALLEAGVNPEANVCYHGGLRRLELKNLRDDPKRDRECADLSDAMGKSLNVVFGKLANKNLEAEDLRAVAGRFLFNQPLPVHPAPPSVGEALVSPAVIPEDELGFGRTAAGFGRVFLSPLHGALMSGAIGNGGVAVEPRLVAAIERDGVRTLPPAPRQERLVSEENARVLSEMLERTVSDGTARKSFLERGRWVLGDVKVAGKTGSLADKQPYKDYSWFVGYVPAHEPRLAVAVVVVNGPKWQVKAPWVARETMRHFLQNERKDARESGR